MSIHGVLKDRKYPGANPYNGELINARPFFDFVHKHYQSNMEEYIEFLRKRIDLLFNYIHFPDNTDQAKIKNVFLEMGALLNALKCYRPEITKGSLEIKN